MPALDQQPTAIDGQLHRLLRLAAVRYSRHLPPLHRASVRRVVEGAHEVECQGFGVGRHARVTVPAVVSFSPPSRSEIMTPLTDEVLARLAKKEKAIRAWIEANPLEVERIARYREEADLYADAAAEIKRLCALMRSKSD